MTYTETGLVGTIEESAGDLGSLNQDQLDAIDQFHSGGPEAVERLLPGLGLSRGMTVLDVGSGLGGPARQVARTVGCAVVGVDITPAYVDTATALTRAGGLDDRVEFVCGETDGLAPRLFDAAYTMHVQMNVADKAAFFAAIAARLHPGGRLAVFEVCHTRATEPPLPLPWSLDGSDSFLATPTELRATIEASGFATLEWTDETAWVVDWFAALGARPAVAAALPDLLDDGYLRMINFAGALSDGLLTIHRGVFAAE